MPCGTLHRSPPGLVADAELHTPIYAERQACCPRKLRGVNDHRTRQVVIDAHFFPSWSTILNLVFPDLIRARAVTYGFGELDALVLAYAATIHESQHSEPTLGFSRLGLTVRFSRSQESLTFPQASARSRPDRSAPGRARRRVIKVDLAAALRHRLHDDGAEPATNGLFCVLFGPKNIGFENQFG